jgi:hypothetical protein
MKIVVVWDIKTQFLSHRNYITPEKWCLLGCYAVWIL